MSDEKLRTAILRVNRARADLSVSRDRLKLALEVLTATRASRKRKRGGVTVTREPTT